MKIKHLITINGNILVVYSTDNIHFSYEIILWDGYIVKPQEMYPTANKAFDIGIDRIKTVIGY